MQILHKVQNSANVEIHWMSIFVIFLLVLLTFLLTFVCMSIKNYWYYADLKPNGFHFILQSFISGIAPLKLVGTPGNRRLQINLFGFLFAVLHLCVFGVCYVRTITVHESLVSYFFKTEISNLGDTLQLCTGLIGIGCVFL